MLWELMRNREELRAKLEDLQEEDQEDHHQEWDQDQEDQADQEAHHQEWIEDHHQAKVAHLQAWDQAVHQEAHHHDEN